ncbi:MAG: addiction module protein [Opitutaceae bacterium]|nr:addiction module protein [Opitutaceae bacterium]
MTKLAEIEAAALRLSDKERLQLTDKLLGSLAPSVAASEPDEIHAEALRRDTELESGQVEPLSEERFWAGAGRARR